MGVVIPDNFGELMFPGLDTIFGRNYSREPKTYTQFMDVVKNMAKATHDIHSISDLGTFEIKEPSVDIALQSPKANYKFSFVVSTYALGYLVAKETLEDDLYGQVVQYTESLANSAAETEEIIAHAIINNGFDTGVTYGDGQHLFSLSHPLGRGGAFANRPANDVDLDDTAIENMLIDLSLYRTDSGNRMPVKAKTIVTSQNNSWTTKKILNSAKEPFTANNADNPAQGIMRHVVSNYIDDSDAWFVMTSVPGGPALRFKRNVTFRKDNLERSDTALFASSFRAVATINDPRSVYGSSGG